MQLLDNVASLFVRDASGSGDGAKAGASDGHLDPTSRPPTPGEQLLRRQTVAARHRKNSGFGIMYTIGELVAASTSSCAVKSIDENGNDLTLATFAPRASSREPNRKILRDLAGYRRLDTVSKAAKPHRPA
jgi:hypothetical protein